MIPTLCHAIDYSDVFDTVFKTNKQNKFGQTRLHLAVYKKDFKQVLACLTDGVDVNIKDIKGKTALHYCAINNCAQSVDLMLSHGASVLIEDQQGNHALWDAVLSCNQDYKVIFQLLLHGSDVHHVNKKGLSSFDIVKTMKDESLYSIFQRFI